MGYMKGYELQGAEEDRNLKRGEIFYINNGSSRQLGSEMKKDRPAVIVSCDANNKHSTMVTIVYLTSSPKKELPTHVTIRSTGRQSEALCEEPTSISVERINNYIGEVSDSEMENIEAALMIGMGINYDKDMQNRINGQLEAYAEGVKIQSGGGNSETEGRRKETRGTEGRSGRKCEDGSGTGHLQENVRRTSGKDDEQIEGGKGNGECL